MIVDAMFGTKGTVFLADAGFVGSCAVTVYGAVKVAYARRMGRPLDTPVTRWLDIAVDAFANVVGVFNKFRVARGLEPILPHPDVVAQTARADAAEAAASNARASLLVAPARPRIDTLPGVPTVPHVGE